MERFAIAPTNSVIPMGVRPPKGAR